MSAASDRLIAEVEAAVHRGDPIVVLDVWVEDGVVTPANRHRDHGFDRVPFLAWAIAAGGELPHDYPCPTCAGSGTVPCLACAGDGWAPDPWNPDSIVECPERCDDGEVPCFECRGDR